MQLLSWTYENLITKARKQPIFFFLKDTVLMSGHNIFITFIYIFSQIEIDLWIVKQLN